jgi:hypothetical protein
VNELPASHEDLPRSPQHLDRLAGPDHQLIEFDPGCPERDTPEHAHALRPSGSASLRTHFRDDDALRQR